MTRTNRSTYFASIPASALTSALVFIDPDNGLEPRSGATTAHVRLEELLALWKRMSSGSVLLVYQHKPRVREAEFWPDAARRLAACLGTPIGWVPFGDVGFLLAARNGRLEYLAEILPSLVLP
ncbi:MAG: hypothetical protein ABR585_13550 [Gemmatimonadaceae bacterium]